MTDAILIALIAGLGGMIGWGLADFFAKITIDKIGDLASLVWAHSIASVLLIGYVLVQMLTGAEGFPVDSGEWLEIFFFGLLQALVYIFVYRGFAKGKLAVLSPIFSSYAGIAAVISILVFNEVLSRYLLLGLILIFCGIILTSMDSGGILKGKFRIVGHPGIVDIATATVLAAVWTVGWAQFVSEKNWQIYASLMYISMSLVIVGFSFIRKTKLKITEAGVWKYLVGIGLAEILAYVSISYGFSESPHTSIIALLSGAFTVPVLILSYLFLKEKVDRLHRVGSLVIIAGIAIISVIR